MTHRKRPWFWVATLITMGVVSGARAGWLTYETEQLKARVTDAREALNANPEEPDEPEAVLANFATWGDLIQQLDRAIDASQLREHAYHTTGAFLVAEPGVRIIPRDELELTYQESLSHMRHEDEDYEEPDSEFGAALNDSDATAAGPYRALTARVRGTATFDAIANFTAELAASEPAMTLDRLTILSASPYPQFDAWIHLDSALPIDSPRELLPPVIVPTLEAGS